LVLHAVEITAVYLDRGMEDEVSEFMGEIEELARIVGECRLRAAPAVRGSAQRAGMSTQSIMSVKTRTE
jgi:hypothetical protein